MKTLDPVILSATTVRLEPFRDEHRAGVQQAASDPRLWEVTVVRAYGNYFDSWWNDALLGMKQGTRMPYAVISQVNGTVIGLSLIHI